MADWSHLRRAQSMGPPPPTLDAARPWLLSGRPATISRRKSQADINSKAEPLPTSEAPPKPLRRYRGLTEASRLKERQQKGLCDALPPRDSGDAERQRGPCEERALPLSRHAPRVLKTRKEKLNPPIWMPTSEFHVRHHASSESDGSGQGLPLGFFSPRVVEQVQRDLKESSGMTGKDAAEAEALVLRVTDGGWAAAITPPTSAASALASAHAEASPRGSPPPAVRAGASELGDAHDEDGIDLSWPLEQDCGLWREKAAAQRWKRTQPRSVLSIVDDFMSSELADEFLPEVR